MAATLAPLLILDDTQALMVDSLRRWLVQVAPFERRAALLATPAAIMPLWQGLGTELGLLGAALPTSVGGQGGGLADQALILQALGEALLPEPYLACAVVGAGLLQGLPGETPHTLLAGLVDGAVRPVLAALEPAGRFDLAQVQATLRVQDGITRLSGRKALVRAAPQATHWLVSARDGHGLLRLALVMPDAAGVQRRDIRLADGGWAAEQGFDQTPVTTLLGEPGVDGLPLLQQVDDQALLLTGAEAIGVMQRLMRETLDHVRNRKQFGVPLASFQVIAHRLADMHLALLQANALVGATLRKLSQPGLQNHASAQAAAQRQQAVASAQVAVCRACRSVGQGAVQLHGGMGMTDELSVGHGFKRLTLIETQGGGLDAQLRRVMSAQTALTA